MPSYGAVFQNPFTVLVSIHAINLEQTLENIAIARTCGADGAFLVCLEKDPASFHQLFIAAKERHPDFWLGAEYACLTSIEALKSAAMVKPDGAWLEDIGYEEYAANSTMEAEFLWEYHLEHCGNGMLLFASVAPKQRPVNSISLAAKCIAPFCDVMMASGAKSGTPPNIEKVRMIKRALSERKTPVGVANGATPGNIREYRSEANLAIVRSSITETGKEKIVPELLHRLMQAARN